MLVPLLTLVFATALSAWLINAIRPLLQRYALVMPNARSSHQKPTPQGAGLAVIAATLTVGGVAIIFTDRTESSLVLAVFAATIFIATVGVIDDLKSMPVLPRFIAHAIAVGSILLALPDQSRIFAPLPLWTERGLLLITGIWFVNLVNFMDGLDWITAAEVIPIASLLAILGISTHLSPSAALTMSALAGAMVGFAPFNRPIAKVFLGDVGSLPIGLLLGWALLELAVQGHIAAAVLLPLYYLSDATVTIFRRMLNRERLWAAHRTHFYQRAIDNGFTVIQVVRMVFGLNIFLVTLAAASVVWTGLVTQLALLVLGSTAVVGTLLRFNRSQTFSGRSRRGIN